MIVDGHVHFEALDLAQAMLDDQERTGTDQFNILVIGRDRVAPGSFRQAEALWFKHQRPKQVFAFGGLDYSGMIDYGRAMPHVPFVEQLQIIMDAGFDGLKLLSGKPDSRKRIGQPLDGAVFTPMLTMLEQTQFPVVWHVSDPPEFRDANAVPLWAKQKQWWYDASHPPRAQIDREIFNVLERHPRLNLILPHFFFMSDDLDGVAKLLDRRPNVQIDLAPGVEMYHNLTARHAQAREFFVRYRDRIIFGTDMGMFRHGTGPKRGWMIRHFLESDDTFDVPEDPAMTPDDRPALRGLALPEAALRNILAANFHRVVGATTPRALNLPVVRRLLLDLADQVTRRGEPINAAAEVLRQLDG